MKRFFDSELWKWIRLSIELVLLGAAIICLYSAFMSLANADPITEQVWVLCEPKGTVNLRSSPGGPVFGGTTCGSELWTDNKQRNGYLHVLELAAEEETGWISARYIVYDQPEEINTEMLIESDGRVAARKWIGGKIIKWMNPGDTVFVYWRSDEWSVTNRGYIMTEYLEWVDDQTEEAWR